MLQRTGAEQVLECYKDFSKQYPSPQAYLDDPEARPFSSLGLHWREEYLRELALILSKTALQKTTRSLKHLPGIGDYVSAAIRSFHLNQRDILIDSNIVRLYGRFFCFDTNGETRRKQWLKDLADSITPKETHRDFNYGLLDFTRGICRPKPKCEACPLRKECVFQSEHS